MCSIAGGEKAQQMLETMRHRSPDDLRVITGDFNMGMGRLAIIDTKRKLCPIVVDDEYILSFNGEIYNYLELKEELRLKGHVFKTDSDGEVLLISYKEWGIDCLDHFNGMFAFAIKDGNKVFFARDIPGEKPLYYTKEPFSFASEAKAFEVDCEELPPAHYGLYDLEKKTLKIAKWWNFVPKIRNITQKQAEEELEYLLEDSIRLRTRSDVPYGLYLSGGIDSTLISTFHDFKHTFTYEDGDYKEEFLKMSPLIYHHLDYPVKSFSPFGLWKLAEQASRKVKVVLSGEGADELFGGYIRFVPNWMNYKAQKEYPSYRRMFPYDPDMEWKEFNGNMRELLRMGDRMASAWGIENRCPFLDRRIIEFAFSLPPEIKYSGIQGKSILRKILKKRKPSYQFQEKHGLYTSANEWLGIDGKYSKASYVAWQKELKL